MRGTLFDSEPDRLQRALYYIREFIARAKGLIEGISVEDLVEKGGINPYMTAALGIDSIEELVELFIHRRVERSLGTSFGTVIENFLREVLGGVSGKDLSPECRGRRRGAERPWVCWWDIIINRPFVEEGRRYKGVALSVKSGPADINKDIVERFIQHAEEAEQNGYRPYLVLTYGKRAFNVAVSTLRDSRFHPEKYLLVGRQIFERFLNDPGYYDRIIDAILSESKRVDIFALMEKKVDELTKELKKKYGDDIKALLKDIS